MPVISPSKPSPEMPQKLKHSHQNVPTQMEPTPISRIQTASPSSVPSETAGEDGENMGPTEGRHISKLQILNEMHLKIKNGEEGVTPQESLELFEGYLVNLNQSYKTNTSMIKLPASEDTLHLLSLIS